MYKVTFQEILLNFSYILGFSSLSTGFGSDFVSGKSNSSNWFRRGRMITVCGIVPVMLEKTPEKNEIFDNKT